ncbi:MAG TPA: mechanosensitive ion channel domain-containing protein [Stellaceae bacterium]|nr:mechanosensitive ion channel domain-containing protein [Stellaceae bacterium]
MDGFIAAPLDWLNAHVDLTRAATIAAVIQLVLIAGGLVVAILLRRLTREPAAQFVEHVDPRLRDPRLISATRSLALPLLWWATIILVVFALNAASYPANLAHIAASLLLAWIVIRATTMLVRDATLSHTIAVIVWFLVAIDILGLRPALTSTLDNFALTIGSLRLSLLTLIEAVLLLTLLVWAAFATSGLLQSRINRISSLTPSVQVLIGNTLKIILIILAVVIALDAVGIDLTALALFSGAVGVGVGLGLQKVVANFASGIILLLDRSIKPGDVIEVGDTVGRITSMAARYVSVRSRDGKDFLLPNEELITNRVVNWTYSSPLVRLDLPFGVSYGSDLRKVREIAVAAAATPARVAKAPAPVCHATSFGGGSIQFLIRFWIADAENGVTNIKGEVLIALYDALVANGIELSSTQYEIRLKDERVPGDRLTQQKSSAAE